jgi:LmbE family N-acetylglucosaminyl deacetylase
MPLLNFLEPLGHLTSGLSFLGVAAYVNFYQGNFRRHMQNARIMFWVLLTASLVFGVSNLGRFFIIMLGEQNTSLGLFLDRVAEYFAIAQPFVLWYLLTKKIVIERKACPGRVLAIGAHPDDIEIAAGAALAKMRDAGYQICGLVLTDGEKGGRAEVRPGEARRGGAFLGLEEVSVEKFIDTRLQSQAVEIANTIETMVKRFKPDIIFTHSAHDLHQDHQAVYEATLRATRNMPVTVLCYESPSVTDDFRPTYFMDVCQYAEVKIHAMREHWDQHEKPYMREEVVRGKLAFRGAQAKVEYAEGFEVQRMISAI